MRHPGHPHPGLVTGGGAVVKLAMSVGQAGDLRRTGQSTGGRGRDCGHRARPARQIVFGASFDNNIICVDEKEVFAVESIVDQPQGRHACQRRRRAARLSPQGARES